MSVCLFFFAFYLSNLLIFIFLSYIRCKREFCYICGETILSAPIHYSTSACAGLQFSEVIELTTRAKIAQYARLAAMPVVVVGAAALALVVVPLSAAIYGVYALKKRSDRHRRYRIHRGNTYHRNLRQHNRRRSQTDGDYGPEYKISVYGVAGVGKFSIISQLFWNTFLVERDYSITGSYRKEFVIDNQVALLDILDTSWHDDYPQDRDFDLSSYFVLVYSITSRSSFDKVNTFIELILRAKYNSYFPPAVLVGNKCDLEEDRQVNTQEGQELARTCDMLFLETSAKSRISIEEAFFGLIRAARRPRFVRSKDEIEPG